LEKENATNIYFYLDWPLTRLIIIIKTYYNSLHNAPERCNLMLALVNHLHILNRSQAHKRDAFTHISFITFLLLKKDKLNPNPLETIQLCKQSVDYILF
jgi:hypothetical protein